MAQCHPCHDAQPWVTSGPAVLGANPGRSKRRSTTSTVTISEIEPAGPFWEAEPEDQDYLQKNPDGDTCLGL